MNQNFGSFNWTEVFPLMFRSTQTTSRSVTIRRTYQNTCTRMAFWNSNELWMNMYLEDAEILFYYEESWNFRHTKIRMWLDTHLEPQCLMSPSTAFYPCIACTPDKSQMPLLPDPPQSNSNAVEKLCDGNGVGVEDGLNPNTRSMHLQSLSM